LTKQRRDEFAAEAQKLKPGKRIHVQEWTDLAGKPIMVTILKAKHWKRVGMAHGVRRRPFARFCAMAAVVRLRYGCLSLPVERLSSFS
jgi:hypothetical protein